MSLGMNLKILQVQGTGFEALHRARRRRGGGPVLTPDDKVRAAREMAGTG